MATIGTITKSKFIGCPVTVQVTPGSVPSGATFHRVRMEVEVGGTYSGTFKFSKPVNGTSALTVDISNAFEALAGQHVYEPTALYGYPVLSCQLRVWDEWLLDGVLSDNSDTAATAAIDGMCAGAISDRDRIMRGTPTRYSYKPRTSPEIAFEGFHYIEAGMLTSAPAVTSYTVKSGRSADHNYYGIPMPRDGYEIRFINSLGVHENVFVTTLRQTETQIQTTRYAISRQETLTQFSRGIAVKQNNHERWKMTSMALDFAWLQWWQNEVMTASKAWVNVSDAGGMASDPVDCFYLPVHILPDETVKGIDRKAASPLAVEFTLEFDINGSPF